MCTCVDPTDPCPSCERRIDDTGADWFFDYFDEGWSAPVGGELR